MRVAAVDLGTNSLRLLVAESPAVPGAVRPGGGAPVDVIRRLEIVRLGEGVDATGRVGAPALTRLAAVLEGYAAEIRRAGAERVRAVATSATRDASNRGEVVAVVRRHLGVVPEVLSGGEEAALTFAGAVLGLATEAVEPLLVVDVGGGSTELALGTRSGPDRWASLDVGSVRMFERHLRDAGGRPADPPAAGAVGALVQDVDSALDAAALPLGSARTVVAVAGTATSVAAQAVRAPTWDDAAMDGVRLDPDRMDEVVDWLVAAPRQERAASPSVHPGRVDVLPAGALVLRTVLRRCPDAAVVVGVRDLLDGAAASLLE